MTQPAALGESRSVAGATKSPTTSSGGTASTFVVPNTLSLGAACEVGGSTIFVATLRGETAVGVITYLEGTDAVQLRRTAEARYGSPHTSRVHEGFRQWGWTFEGTEFWIGGVEGGAIIMWTSPEASTRGADGTGNGE